LPPSTDPGNPDNPSPIPDYNGPEIDNTPAAPDYNFNYDYNYGGYSAPNYEE
jgi:hypothetical protein